MTVIGFKKPVLAVEKIGECLGEITALPPISHPSHSPEEYARIHTLCCRIDDALRNNDALELGRALIDDARAYMGYDQEDS